MVFTLRKMTKITVMFFLAGLILKAPAVNGYLLTNSCTNINGETISFSSFEGKLLFVEAFASDCYWCQKEHPELEKLYQEFASEINMVSISIKSDETVETLTQYIADYPTSWLIGFDDGLQFAREFNIKSTPTMLLFNQEGQLLSQKVGYTEYAELSSMISQYLSLPNPQPSNTLDGHDSRDRKSVV